MKTNFEKIKSFIDSSHLSENDKKDLLDIFGKADETDLVEIADLIENDPSLVSSLSDNLKAKRIALGAKNGDLWSKILAEEKSQLEGLEN